MWQSLNFKHLIFRLEDLHVWAVGPKVGVNYVYLVHVDGNVLCPERLTDGVSPWFYLSTGSKIWKTDMSVSLTCMQ